MQIDKCHSERRFPDYEQNAPVATFSWLTMMKGKLKIPWCWNPQYRELRRCIFQRSY